MAKNWKLYQATGLILDKVYIKKPTKPAFIKLKVRLENNPTKKISVFPDKLQDQSIWTALQNNEFIDKRYLLKYTNYMGQYHLADWEELPLISAKPPESPKQFNHD